MMLKGPVVLLEAKIDYAQSVVDARVVGVEPQHSGSAP
jgi:hypothetical protein